MACGNARSRHAAQPSRRPKWDLLRLVLTATALVLVAVAAAVLHVSNRVVDTVIWTIGPIHAAAYAVWNEPWNRRVKLVLGSWAVLHCIAILLVTSRIEVSNRYFYVFVLEVGVVVLVLQRLAAPREQGNDVQGPASTLTHSEYRSPFRESKHPR